MNGNTNDPQLQATIERTIEVTRERVATGSLQAVLCGSGVELDAQLCGELRALAQHQLASLATMPDRTHRAVVLATVPTNGREAELHWRKEQYEIPGHTRFFVWVCASAELLRAPKMSEETALLCDLAEDSLRAACGFSARPKGADACMTAADLRARQWAMEALEELERNHPFAREVTLTVPSPLTGRRVLCLWRSTRVVFPHLVLDGFGWKCVSAARAPREGRPVGDVVDLCDALEWMLATHGHRHVGAVVVVPGAPDDGLVWTNRPRAEDTESDPVRFDAPELALRLVVHRNGDVELLAGGSLNIETDVRVAVMRRLVRAIDEAGWAVQKIDARGVHVARIAPSGGGR